MEIISVKNVYGIQIPSHRLLKAATLSRTRSDFFSSTTHRLIIYSHVRKLEQARVTPIKRFYEQIFPPSLPTRKNRLACKHRRSGFLLVNDYQSANCSSQRNINHFLRGLPQTRLLSD